MRYANIGGQAVIEGVMMRYKDLYAVAVRKEDGSVQVEHKSYEGLNSRFHTRRIPIVRGVLAFLDSLYLGIGTLTWSAELADDEEEEEQEKEKSRGAEIRDRAAIVFSLVLSVVIAVALFMLAPLGAAALITGHTDNQVLIAVVEGIVRLIIFFLYIYLISKMKDIERVFMYHGAEHKTINCIEHGLELTPENAEKCSRLHKRCGTSFLLYVMIISIIVFMFVRASTPVGRVVSRLVLIPLVAGLSYEFIQFAGRSNSKISDVLSRPGLAMQKLTTKEPDRDMLEVAIASIEAIYDWRGFQKEVSAAVRKAARTMIDKHRAQCSDAR
ncbi:MAG: DUF1385 domain-containing protein [Lachnospiraceae bacterium]